MTSERKKVRAEFKKAFDTKNVKKIEQLRKRNQLTKMIDVSSIAKYLDKSYDNDREFHSAILDEIYHIYDFMDLYFSIIDINSVKLVEELLMGNHSDNAYRVLFHHALDRGRLSIAELIYPQIVEQYETKSYSKFKEFVDNNWFTVDEDDISEDGFILAVVSNRSDLVKKILRLGEIDISVRDNFALTYACDYGYAAIVKILLKYDKDCFYADNKYAYKLAKRRNYVDMVKMMKEVMGLGY